MSKPLPRGSDFGIVSEVPLAKTGRRVALGFQVVSDGVLVGVESLGRLRKQNMLVHAHPFRIATRQQRRARGRAHGRSHHKVRKPSAFGGNAIDVRRLDLGRTETTEVAIALVIGKDNDEVRLGVGRMHSSNQRNDQEDRREEHFQRHRVTRFLEASGRDEIVVKRRSTVGEALPRSQSPTPQCR